MNYIPSNPTNRYSEQRLPTYIYKVIYVDMVSKKYPYGMAQVEYYDKQYEMRDITKPIKVYKNKKGKKFVYFGKNRLDIATKNTPVNLLIDFS